MKEDYVSFEIAKLLKEKGFGGGCLSMYVTPKHRSGIGNPNEAKIAPHGRDSHYYEGYLYQCEAPTHQMAMKWLREKGIYITIVYGDYPSLNKVFWTPQIDSLEGFDLPDSFYEEYDKYENAVEAAIKYSLENLI